MSDVTEILAYLRARYDEREAAAKAATPVHGPSWHAAAGEAGNGWVWGKSRSRFVLPNVFRAPVAEHIALNDPASVLADIESKRKILDVADRLIMDADEMAGGKREHALGEWITLAATAKQLLQALARPFRDRPDFPEKWRQGPDISQ